MDHGRIVSFETGIEGRLLNNANIPALREQVERGERDGAERVGTEHAEQRTRWLEFISAEH